MWYAVTTQEFAPDFLTSAAVPCMSRNESAMSYGAVVFARTNRETLS
jgi:hypothetical protein